MLIKKYGCLYKFVNQGGEATNFWHERLTQFIVQNGKNCGVAIILHHIRSLMLEVPEYVKIFAKILDAKEIQFQKLKYEQAKAKKNENKQ